MNAEAKQVAIATGPTFAEMQRLASSIVKSGLFGVKDVDQAVALMSIAVAEGKHPATIARDFDIIQGRQAKKSEAMLRDSLSSGLRVEWHELTDEVADATFSHPAGGSARIRWDIARAQRAGLTGKDNWKKYPRAMLRSRVVSEGCRTVCPMATSGMYTPEEVADMPPAEPVDVTPPKVAAKVDAAVKAVSTALTEEERNEHIRAMKESGDIEGLAAAFAAAWEHAKQAKDKPAADAFKAVYENCKSEVQRHDADHASA